MGVVWAKLWAQKILLLYLKTFSSFKILKFKSKVKVHHGLWAKCNQMWPLNYLISWLTMLTWFITRDCSDIIVHYHGCHRNSFWYEVEVISNVNNYSSVIANSNSTLTMTTYWFNVYFWFWIMKFRKEHPEKLNLNLYQEASKICRKMQLCIWFNRVLNIFFFCSCNITCKPMGNFVKNLNLGKHARSHCMTPGCVAWNVWRSECVGGMGWGVCRVWVCGECVGCVGAAGCVSLPCFN